MQRIEAEISGVDLDFAAARAVAEQLARIGNREAELIAWADRAGGNHSPSCVKCVIGERPGWEVYGENHGGRVRVSLNQDAYVFIWS